MNRLGKNIAGSLLLALGLCANDVWAKDVQIANDTLSASYDDASHLFTLTDKASGKTFVKNGTLDNAGEVLGVKPVRDNVFGEGQRISIVRSTGGEIGLEVYPHLPFALVRGTIANTGKDNLDIPRVATTTFTQDLGKSAKELAFFGTGGMSAGDKSPGSYLFLTTAHPESRNGIVTGWITQDRGCGVVFGNATKNKEATVIKARIDYGHLRIAAGNSAVLETLAIGYFSDARLGEEAYADAIKKYYAIKLRAPMGAYCTWYAGRGRGGNDADMRELSKTMAKELKPFGLYTIQIDAGWQGVLANTNRNNHDSMEKCEQRDFETAKAQYYPQGIAPLAEALAKDGIATGIWWLPFGRFHDDATYENRQDWFVKNADGSVFNAFWGGDCLDLTVPAVREHLAKIAKLYRSWGVTYYKMDGLWTGTATACKYVHDGYLEDKMDTAMPLHDPFVTQIEAYRSGLKLIRDNTGDDVFFSGCNISQNMRSMCAMGLVDSMRIGPDLVNDSPAGPLRGTRLYFLNGRTWWNDPDPCRIGSRISLEAARLNTSWVALAGQFFLISDWLPKTAPEKIEVLKRTIAHHDGTARPVDAFDRVLPNTWLISDEISGVRRDVAGVFNWDKEPLNAQYTFEKMGLNPGKTYYAFDFWANRPLPEVSKTFQADCPTRTCRVIALRAQEGHPVLVSTSRHVSSGIMEVKQEQWKDDTLSGVSEVVGNDPYELRIMGLNEGGRQWQVAEARVSEDDKAAGVTVQQKQEDGLLRLTIIAPAGRDVKWQVGFKEKS